MITCGRHADQSSRGTKRASDPIYTNVPPGFILHQLPGDVLATGGARGHFGLALPSAIRAVRVKRRRSGVGHSGGRHEACGSIVLREL